MLIGIDPLLTPDLLRILGAMGHGDEIVIVDANYPATSNARRLVRLDGADVSQVLKAVLSVLPLELVRQSPGKRHAGGWKAPGDSARDRRLPEDRRSPRRLPGQDRTHRAFAFYERAKTCFAVVATSDRRFYANIILTKGVIGADGKVVK